MMLRITQRPSQKSLNLPLQHFPSNYRFHIWDTLEILQCPEERGGREGGNIESCLFLRYLCDLRASGVRILTLPLRRREGMILRSAHNVSMSMGKEINSAGSVEQSCLLSVRTVVMR
jgi:hypothetical protein